jgi:hypothetical protein
VLFYFRQSQNVTREKLREALLYEQGAHKMLMKLTSGKTKNRRTFWLSNFFEIIAEKLFSFFY